MLFKFIKKKIIKKIYLKNLFKDDAIFKHLWERIIAYVFTINYDKKNFRKFDSQGVPIDRQKKTSEQFYYFKQLRCRRWS